MYLLRICKGLLVASIALFFTLVVFNNTTDYESNFEYVRHVLSMDDTFKNNAAMWRAWRYPAVHHLFYMGIILWEAICAVACTAGAYCLLKAADAAAPVFVRAKIMATVGITLSLLLWLVAFLTIGGEWFLMWQSQTWNGQAAAFRMFAIEALVLIFLWQKEEIES